MLVLKTEDSAVVGAGRTTKWSVLLAITRSGLCGAPSNPTTVIEPHIQQLHDELIIFQLPGF